MERKKGSEEGGDDADERPISFICRRTVAAYILSCVEKGHELGHATT